MRARRTFFRLKTARYGYDNEAALGWGRLLAGTGWREHLLSPNARTCESFRNPSSGKLIAGPYRPCPLSPAAGTHVVIVYREVERLANARAFLAECVADLRAVADGEATD